tara:strand:+ start:937 stop:1374 length:438 start_codon:yes stop_codon:yes gene_type:complete
MINIYKLTCETDKTYYGSTSRNLNIRLLEHKRHKKNTCKDFINPKIELLETCEKEKQKERERYYIKTFDCVNYKQPGRHIKDNDEQHQEYKKAYYKKTKNKVCEQRKEKTTCECGAIVNKGALTRHKKSNKHKINISVLNKNISI